ncbi:hypothetical protein [Variibacter gotjawalensis]|uniref:hypothetical protein n=1 Tax=Variibacter gotjawalensis TaxID=1333996 RepID=UPI00102CE74D|nr:hypothetical protein [Variibacter gotjawalensis]NIK46447.1 hypothetical protein [Variibacter gotjawalensis]
MAVEALFAGEMEAIARKAIELALAGDTVAVRIVLDRIAPLPRGRLIKLPDWQPLNSLADVPPAIARLCDYVAGGQITPEEAMSLASIIDKFTNACGMLDQENRIAALEERLSDAAA